MGEAFDLTAQLMENAAHYNPQRAVILLTDGLPTYLDEHRAEQEAKFAAAIARFQAERIKVFPIALGGAADVNFLQQHVAAPTGGLVWRAESAEQLVGVFIEILERLQQGRYVDRYEILGNVDTFLANVNPRQQIEQIKLCVSCCRRRCTPDPGAAAAAPGAHAHKRVRAHHGPAMVVMDRQSGVHARFRGRVAHGAW